MPEATVPENTTDGPPINPLMAEVDRLKRNIGRLDEVNEAQRRETDRLKREINEWKRCNHNNQELVAVVRRQRDAAQSDLDEANVSIANQRHRIRELEQIARWSEEHPKPTPAELTAAKHLGTPPVIVRRSDAEDAPRNVRLETVGDDISYIRIKWDEPTRIEGESTYQIERCVYDGGFFSTPPKDAEWVFSCTTKGGLGPVGTIAFVKQRDCEHAFRVRTKRRDGTVSEWRQASVHVPPAREEVVGGVEGTLRDSGVVLNSAEAKLLRKSLKTVIRRLR